MAPNKRKILEAARKLAQKGQKERSLKEYEKLLKLDPRDAKLRLEIGDAHRRWGQVGEAIAAYTRVAEQYMAEGFDARAVAVFKQIQNLDPEHYEAYVPLSELYERMGLTSEAIQALQTAADGLHKQGNKREALDLLRRMAALDPANTSSRIKVADLLRQEGLTSDAVIEYEAARAELEKQGEHEAAGNVLERILEADPNRLATVVALAQNLLKRGQGNAAEALARRALETDDQEPDHYELLADVCRVQGRDDELKNTYKRLAELYRQRGDEDRARDIIQRFVPMEDFAAAIEGNTEPNDLDAGLVGGMGTLDLAQPGGLDATAHDEAEDGLGDELLEDEILMEVPLEPAPPEPLADEAVLELSEDPAPEILLDTPKPTELDDEPAAPPVQGDPDQLLAEASVYLRYGKRDQAIRNLEAVVEREPGHRAALEKLGEAYAEGSETSAAVDTWMRAAELARDAGDSEGLAVLRDRIGALDEAAAAGLGPEPSGAASEPAEPAPELDDLIDLSDVAEEPEADRPAADLAESGLDLDDDIEIDVDIDMDAIGMDADVEPEQIAETEVPGLDEVELDDSDLELEAPEDEPAPARAAAPGPSASSTQQIQEELEEAEFYHQQGLIAEARAIYQRVLELAPNHPLALVRMGELEADSGGDPNVSGSGDLGPSAGDGLQGAAGDDLDASVGDDLEASLGDDLEASLGDDLDPGADGLPLPSLEADAQADGDAAAEDSGDIGRDLAQWSEDDLGAEIEIEDPDEVAIPDEVGIDLDAEAPGDTAPELDLAGVDAASSLADASGDSTGTDTLEDDDGLLPPDPDTVVSESAFEAEPLVQEQDAPLPPPTPEPVAPPALAPEGATFDLAAELSGALDDGAEGSASGRSQVDDDGFSAVFREFKKGVSKALDEGDHEAHWDLGIAYREMGLFDDAIGEFEAALASSARRIDGLHMIAICALDLGRADDASARLEDALASAGLRDEQQTALRFDLGRAYECQGRIEEARTAWEAVVAAEPGFCDVSERLAGLGEAKPDPDPTQEYESFDDLIDDDDPTGEPADPGHESFEDLIAEASGEVDPAPPASSAGPDPGDTLADPVLRSELEDSAAADSGASAPAGTGSGDPGNTVSDSAGDSAANDSADSGSARPKPRRKKKISFV